MKLSLKKSLGVLALVLAAPLLFGGTVACGKDCVTRCNDYVTACAPVMPRDCVVSCDPVTACSKEEDGLAECVGTNCACEKDSSSAPCIELLTVKCKTQFDAYSACAFG